MAVKSGVGAQLVVATESTYGTYVAPTRAVPFMGEDISLANSYIDSEVLRAGRLAQSAALSSKTTRQAAGSISARPLQRTGEGIFFNQLHGGTITPTTPGGGTTSRLQTHAIGTTDPSGKSLTVQVGRPDVGGTVRPFSALGAKVPSMTFSCEQGGQLMVETAIDAQDLVTSQSIVTPTYPANNLAFDFTQCSIEFDDVVFTECVRSFSVTIENPHNTERFCIGNAGLKKEPLQNGLTTVEAELEMEFASLTQYAAFQADTRRKVEFIFTGAIIEAAIPYQFSIVIPSTSTRSASATVDGPEVLTQTISLKGLDDGTNPVASLLYQNTDTTI